jgi:hypothetical protein
MWCAAATCVIVLRPEEEDRVSRTYIIILSKWSEGSRFNGTEE